MAERLGMFTGAALAYLIAGSVGCVVLAVQGRLIPVLRAADRRYLWGCGALMLLYTVLLYSAVGLAENRAGHRGDRRQLSLAQPDTAFLGAHTRLEGQSRSAGDRLGRGGGRRGADAGSGQFSDGSHRVEPGHSSRSARRSRPLRPGACIPRLADAGRTARRAVPCRSSYWRRDLALLALCIAMQEQSTWNLRGIVEALYVAIFPTLLAYTFWDFAVRRGNLRLVAPASYIDAAVFCMDQQSLPRHFPAAAAVAGRGAGRSRRDHLQTGGAGIAPYQRPPPPRRGPRCGDEPHSRSRGVRRSPPGSGSRSLPSPGCRPASRRKRSRGSDRSHGP